jgi:predicted Zn-dependent protease
MRLLCTRNAFAPLVVVLVILSLTGCAPQDAAFLQNLLDKEVFPHLRPEMAQRVTPLAHRGLGLAATSDVSLKREQELADENAGKWIVNSPMSSDKDLENYLNYMAQRIARAADPTPFTYRVRLINSSNVNAFTVGGGHIFVTTGLVGELQTEAQMAMVLAHEMAHITRRHVIRGIRDMTAIRAIGDTAYDYLSGKGHSSGVPPWLLEVAYQYTSNAMVNGYGRSAEEEADLVGLSYMATAGYDPFEAPKAFEQFARLEGKVSSIQNFFHGNHPLAGQRAEYIRAMLPKFPPSTGGTRNTKKYIQLTAKYLV